jgi:DNA-binding SARP family transcriptional activator
MSRLALTLFGGFGARRETGEVIELASRKAQALLAFLALPPGAAHPRDKLAALLWPELSAAPARANLRQVLFALRHALAGSDPLQTDGDTVALDPARVDIDTADFESALHDPTPERLAAALALYRGDLLEGLRVQEAPYEEWLAAERERLREGALEGLARLLTHQRSSGDLEAAVQTALRLLALDPLQEPVHRALMRLYAALGRRSDALRQYHLCVTALRRDLDVDPEAETKALYQDIVRRRAAAAVHGSGAVTGGGPDDRVERRWRPVDDVPMVGRAAERARLAEALALAWAGRAQAVVLTGEAGIGKSRLVREVAGEVEARGGTVAAGLAFETEQVLPFRPWIAALRAGRLLDPPSSDRLTPIHRAALGHVFPEIGRATAPAGEFDFLRLFEAVAAIIRASAARQPVLIALEDLHWADEMSLRLLAFLCRQLRDAAVLVLLTVRDGEPSATLLHQTLGELRHDGRLTLLPIAPLSRAETAALAAEVIPHRPRGLDEQIWHASRGNPFVAVETLRALSAGARAPGAGDELPVATAVRTLVARQLNRLGEAGRRAAAAAAVIGREFDFALLPRVADLDEERAAEAVEELVRHRLLHDVGGRFELAHDLIRQIVYDEILPPRRAVLHRRVAAAIEAAHGPDLAPHVTALATHYRLAAAWPEAAHYLERAGLAAAAHSAHRDAALLFEHALAALSHLADSTAARRRACELHFKLGYSLSLTGSFEDALAHYAAAAALADALGDARSLWFARGGRASVLASLGRYQEGLALAEPVLAATAAATDHRGQFWIHIQLARIGNALGDYRRSAEHARRASASLFLAPTMEGVGADYPPDLAWRYWLLLNLSALGAFAEAAILAEQLGRGGHDRPVASAYTRILSGSCLGIFEVARGAIEHGVALLEPALELCRRADGFRPFARGAAALASAYVLAGRAPEAIALMEEFMARLGEARFSYLVEEVECRLAEAHLDAGHLGDADRTLSAALSRARSSGARGIEAGILRALGDLIGQSPGGDPSLAARHLASAACLADSLGMRPLVARCRLDLARLYHVRGQPDRARALLVETAGEFRELGMSLWLSRAETALAALG